MYLIGDGLASDTADGALHGGQIDGQSLFHIVTTDVDLSERTVRLELGGSPRSADVLLARLAEATRIVTG